MITVVYEEKIFRRKVVIYLNYFWYGEQVKARTKNYWLTWNSSVNGLRLGKVAYSTIQAYLYSKHLLEIYRRHVSNLIEICQILCTLLPIGGRDETTSWFFILFKVHIKRMATISFGNWTQRMWRWINTTRYRRSAIRRFNQGALVPSGATHLLGSLLTEPNCSSAEMLLWRPQPGSLERLPCGWLCASRQLAQQCM